MEWVPHDECISAWLHVKKTHDESLVISKIGAMVSHGFEALCSLGGFTNR